MGKLRFFFGAAVGAAAALLLAPRSGKETRQLLSEKIEDVTESAPEPIRNAAETVEGAYADLRGKAAPAASPDSDDIKAKIAEARDALAEQITRNRTATTQVEADVEDAPVDLDEIIDIPAEPVEAAEDVTAEAVAEAVEEAVEEAAPEAEAVAEAAEEAL